MLPAPPVDPRTSDDVVRQLLKLLRGYSGEASPEVVFSPDKGASRALIEIFGRFSELIIERLNQVPNKNLLAFLDLIGASLLPPQPARVPLTFSLVNGAIVDGLVPSRTQVAAVDSEGETAPVVFETEEELVVTAAQLVSLFVRRPDQDKYAHHSALINSISANEVPLFLGNRRVEHLLYLAHDSFFSDPGLTTLTLVFEAKANVRPNPLTVIWETWSGSDWISLRPENVTDGTSGLTRSGEVTFKILSPLLRNAVNGMDKYWLRCRLLTPIPPAAYGPAGKLPELMPVQIKAATSSGKELKVEHAIANDTKVDVVKGFFPFGERPKAGDTFYLAHREAFKKLGATVTLHIKIANSPKAANVDLAYEFWDGNSWSPLTKASDTTNSLTKTGDVGLTIPKQPVSTTINGSESFWIRCRLASGNYGEEAHFALRDPSDPSKGYLYADADLDRRTDGRPNPYYGDPAKGYKLIPVTYAPPLIGSLTVDYSFTQSPPAGSTLKPEVVLTYNDFEYREVTREASFKPFQSVADVNPTVYLGFTLPPGLKNFPNRKISFYAALLEFKQGENLIPISPGSSKRATKTASTVTHKFIVTNPTTQTVGYSCEAIGNRWSASVDVQEITVAPGQSKELSVIVTIPESRKAGESDRGFLTLKLKSAPANEYSAVFITYFGDLPVTEQSELIWEYSTGTSWSNLTVRDYSENLGKPGLIEFLAPPDFKESREFGLQRYWLRVIWNRGEYLFDPQLRGLLLNTTMATQAVTIEDEVLGSSNQTASQLFHTIRSPILAGSQLYVREPELPPANERTKIEEERAGPAVETMTGRTDHSKEIWVRWDQTPDFYGSGPRDRHYVLDSLTGEVRFGDGQNGLIPPAGNGNIRMSHYRTGGGTIGNKPAGAITQLKTTVPYVRKVVNHLPATGGSEGETTDSLRKRAPRALRHGDRAVTVKDYEDLALLASTEVARAKCLPLTNLISDDSASESIRNGTVSLIIVPHSTEAKSAPSLELIGRVQEFIGRRQNPLAELVVTGPKYVGINVEVDVAPVSFDGAGEIKLVIARTISSYLHPLTGGMDGNGWDFGRYPHESNLYALIEAVSGVDHVKSLKLTPGKDSAEVKKAGAYFLVYSGMHTINLKS